MSYYTTPTSPLVYFGESAGADRWIEENVRGAARVAAAWIDQTIPPTEVHPGVQRYVAPEQEDDLTEAEHRAAEEAFYEDRAEEPREVRYGPRF